MSRMQSAGECSSIPLLSDIYPAAQGAARARMFQTYDEGAAAFMADEVYPLGRHTKAWLPAEKDA